MAIDLDPAWLYRIERCEGRPTIDQIVAIAEGLGVEPEVVFRDVIEDRRAAGVLR